MLDSRPLWRNYEWERSGKVRKPGYLKALWRNRQSNHMRALVAGDTSDAFTASLWFVIARFANLGDLDEILQLGISDWHSTFCNSYLLASAHIRHFVIGTWHSNLNSRPQNAAPGDRYLPFPRPVARFSSRAGQKPEGGSHFKKSIGCM